MNHYDGPDKGGDSDVHGLHEDHIAPKSDDGRHGYNAHDDNYCDDAKIKNRSDGINYPNAIDDDAGGLPARCQGLPTCDAKR